ncbi:hypothetical protein [Dyadobacter sp. CY345]|uniref:hypothetical protein n=1 Tax=Dyadobacter sp. CY345 TaxID=2909335 RepID=UPI00286E4EB4|nr:hypothetical protein [Dyadobacter sp. CY345]
MNDLHLNYNKSRYAIGLSIQNLFNTRWKETQFATESRLKGKTSPVEEIHFTHGLTGIPTLIYILIVINNASYALMSAKCLRMVMNVWIFLSQVIIRKSLSTML